MISSPHPSRRVLAVIVNYRTADLVMRHFDNMVRARAEADDLRVVIVDNASPGDDAQKLRAFAADPSRRDWVDIVESPDNRGFAAGNNLVLGPALASDSPPDFFLLLNPDAYLRPGALKALLDVMQARPEVGIAGPGLENEAGETHNSAFRFFSIASEFEAAARTGLVSRLLSRWRVAPAPALQAGRVDWICGAAALIRRETLADVGLLDETYFLYYEETDFMLRAARKGWATWCEPTSRAVHFMGGATGYVQHASAPPPDYWYRSRAHYFRKNHGAAYAAAADLAWTAGALFYLVRPKRRPDRGATWASIRRFARMRRGDGRTAAAG